MKISEKLQKEEQYLTQFFHLIVWVSTLIFVIDRDKFKVLLIKRPREPFQGKWSLPGDVLQATESLEDTAKKALQTHIETDTTYLEQLYTFGEPDREPRGRVLSVTYFTLLNSEDIKCIKELAHPSDWFSVDSLPAMAFDHKTIIEYATQRICSKLEYSNIAKYLLPEKFRLSELQKTYEIIRDEKIDKRNFIKKMKSYDLLTPLDETMKAGSHRPAKLYKFKADKLVMFDKK